MQKTVIKNEYFDVKATLTCGQVFRYTENSDGSFTVYSLDKKCTLTVSSEGVTLESDDLNYFLNYFDLSTDYGEIVRSLSAFPELGEKVNFGKGIRILRQAFYETLFSFIISANNNITRIKGIIERLCARYGKNMGDYYAFPTPDELKTATVDDLKGLGLGYRADYIYTACRQYESLPPLENLNADEIKEVLLTVKGIGPKVADCITLFGLAVTSSYPVDTWIFKANRTDELNTPKKVRKFYSDRYGKYAGYAQQYIFYYERENKK